MCNEPERSATAEAFPGLWISKARSRERSITAGSSARPHVTSSVAVATANNKPET